MARFCAENLEQISDDGLGSEAMSRPTTALAENLAGTGRKQAWLANELNIHPSSVSRWASGERPLPIRYVQPIADALQVEPSRLLRDVDERHQ
jgi:DNA-binding transcriptional regulator YdaS (Cro superfamily)